MPLYKLRKILDGYTETIYKLSNGKSKARRVFLFVPVVVASVLSVSGILITPDVASGLISMLAILVGFTVNAGILLMNYTIEDDEDQANDKRELKKDILRISTYSIISGIVALVISGSILLVVTNTWLSPLPWNIGLKLASGVLYAILINFLFSLLLLPSRLYAVISTV